MTIRVGEPVWGYGRLLRRRYGLESLLLVLYPPEAPLRVRRLLQVHRLSGPLFLVTFVAVAAVGATIVILELAAALALACATALNATLRRATHRTRRRCVRVEVGQVHPDWEAIGQLRTLDEFLDVALRRSTITNRREQLEHLWRQLYREYRRTGDGDGHYVHI